MKRSIYLKYGKITFSFLLILLVIFWEEGFAPAFSQKSQEQENNVKRAKIFKDYYSLISESDLYCSFFVWDGKNPAMKIVGSERQDEKTLLSDGDVIYLDKGKQDGFQPGQLFLIVEIGSEIKDFGPLAFKRGRARLKAVEENRASARIERSCGKVMAGDFLFPFEEKEGQLGRDLGYAVLLLKDAGLSGHIIYVQTDFIQIGSGQWALIDLGEQDGIQVGQQLVVYRAAKKEESPLVLGNSVVIDAQKRTATIKVLSCKDAINMGDQVQPHPK